MNNVVLDASALLALINDEKGSDVVKNALKTSMMSTVNVAEVVTSLTKIGVPINDSKHMVNSLLPTVVDFTNEQAFLTGELYTKTKSVGLSLGDRSCLSLAKTKNIPVLTADKIWKKLNIGVDIQLIR